MFTSDYACDKCKLKITNIEIDKDNPSRKPTCPKCENPMFIKNTCPMINMATSDLPHSLYGGEHYQPAFGRVTTSKADAKRALAEFNARERDLAIEGHYSFKEYEFLGDSDEFDKQAKDMDEMGVDAYNSMMKDKYETTMKNRLEEKLEPILKDFPDFSPTNPEG